MDIYVACGIQSNQVIRHILDLIKSIKERRQHEYRDGYKFQWFHEYADRATDGCH
jgi:hypothetical protein